ncbi:hypothetical protein RDWZM_006004 [Blomia tropicalis]|uniref:Uncharacterized protein n=1 Tax=Blomia tropicalis TaxID=40697 RepID=A0A9Q0M724_BLOTA|nr:hypothetical protein RDWZM_006004 [Blomia tropicalis]
MYRLILASFVLIVLINHEVNGLFWNDVFHFRISNAVSEVDKWISTLPSSMNAPDLPSALSDNEDDIKFIFKSSTFYNLYTSMLILPLDIEFDFYNANKKYTIEYNTEKTHLVSEVDVIYSSPKLPEKVKLRAIVNQTVPIYFTYQLDQPTVYKEDMYFSKYMFTNLKVAPIRPENAKIHWNYFGNNGKCSNILRYDSFEDSLNEILKNQKYGSLHKLIENEINEKFYIARNALFKGIHAHDYAIEAKVGGTKRL